MLLPLLLLVANSAALGQELPPGPTTVYRTSLPAQAIEGEFELINLILDFEPGAATPPHTHGGPGMVTVLTEEIVFGMEGMPDLVARPGEVYHDLPGRYTRQPTSPPPRRGCRTWWRCRRAPR